MAVVVVADPRTKAVRHVLERAHRLRKAVEHAHAVRGMVGVGQHGPGLWRQRESLDADVSLVVSLVVRLIGDRHDHACRRLVVRPLAHPALGQFRRCGQLGRGTRTRRRGHRRVQPQLIAQVDHACRDCTLELGEQLEREQLQPVGIRQHVGHEPTITLPS